MKLSRFLNVMLFSTALASCSDLTSPELIPCMCDGTEKTLGLFECMCEPGKSKPVKKVKRQAYIQNEPQIDPTQDQLNAYAYLHQSRNQYAPVKLDYVDFRIPKGQYYEQYTNKLGNYRFRIFGCRRFDKEVFLNQGRAMQKDMKFFDIFYETMNDYYPVVVEKNNPYYMYSDKAQAEYVLTAEINDYFMNVCDEFDWDNVKKKDLRTGTSEMTVTWRLMDLTKSKVYCKGTTTGYGEMKDGEYKGEVLLVERAFADALSKLPQIKCYNEELSKRVSPEEIQRQLAQIKTQEQSKITFKNQYAEELNAVNALQSCGSKDLKPQDLLPASVKDNNFISETGNSNSLVKFAADSEESLTSGNIIRGYINDEGSFVFVDENGNIIEDSDSLSSYNIVSDLGNSVAKGQVVSGYIDENGKFVVVDKGEVDTKTAFVSDEGNVLSKGRSVSGYVDENGKFVVVDEKGETTGKGQTLTGYVDENGNFVALNSVVTTENGVSYDNLLTGFINENQEFIVIDEAGAADGKVYEIAGIIEADGKFMSKAEIEERSGGMSKFNNYQKEQTKKLRLADNCSQVTIDEAGCTSIKVAENTIKYNDDYWIDMPIEESSGSVAIQNRLAAEKMYSDSYSDFCIQSVKPYESLSPQNMYRLRASVVSVENPSGRKGAGLIISDQLILTSADLVDKQQNRFNIQTINGMDYTGSAFRVNPNKNVALILLDEKTKFNPLPLRLALPEVGKEMFMTLGLLDFDEGENYLETEGEVIGYRYSEEKGAEIIVDTNVQTQTLGSSLIDKNGNITGLSHSGIRTKEGGDLFIPIETALKSVGLNICGVKFTNKKPIALKAIDKPVSTAIDNSKGSKAPKAMSVKERK